MKRLGEVLTSICEQGVKHHDEMIDHHEEMIDTHEAAITAHEDAMEEAETQKAHGSEATHHIAFHKAAIKSHKAAIESHQSAIGSHEIMKARYEDGVQECSKAIAADNLEKANRLVPDNVHGIIPNYPGVTAVPRAGQRQIEKTEVPLELQKVLALPDDEQP
jgi:hypothetical protein